MSKATCTNLHFLQYFDINRKYFVESDKEFNNVNENYDKLEENYLQGFYDKNKSLLSKGIIKNKKRQL